MVWEQPVNVNIAIVGRLKWLTFLVCKYRTDTVIWSLQNAGVKVIKTHGNIGNGPDLMVVVLPGSSANMYRSVKQ